MVGRPRGDVLSQVVDPASDRPVFRQISDHLRELISLGAARRLASCCRPSRSSSSTTA